LNLQALYQNVSIFRNDICENDYNSENNSLKKKRRERRGRGFSTCNSHLLIWYQGISGGGFYVPMEFFDSCGKFDMRL